MPRPIRWILVSLYVVATLASIAWLFGMLMLEPAATSFGPHGRLIIVSPGPAHVALPALACMWREDSSYRVPDTQIPYSGEVQTAWVVCRIPSTDAVVPIGLDYGIRDPNTIHAFLRSIPGGFQACASNRASVIGITGEKPALFHLCSSGDPPPRSEWAQFVPSDSDAPPQPVPVMRIEFDKGY